MRGRYIEQVGRGYRQHRPGFVDYLRVMQRGPCFWGVTALCVIAFSRLALQGSLSVVLLAAVVGVATIVLYFPIWRALAIRFPRLATDGHPELLDERHVDTPLHPGEPSSNVRSISR